MDVHVCRITIPPCPLQLLPVSFIQNDDLMSSLRQSDFLLSKHLYPVSHNINASAHTDRWTHTHTHMYNAVQ